LGNHRTHTAEFCGLGDLVFKEIPVTKCCGSRQDHFRHCQDCAVINHFLRDETCFHRENVMIEPVHQRKVVCQSPETDHGQVRVRVDQSGQNKMAFRVDGFVCLGAAVTFHQCNVVSPYA